MSRIGYLYLGSIKKDVSHGFLVDAWVNRISTIPSLKRKEHIRRCLEVHQAMVTLGLDAFLDGALFSIMHEDDVEELGFKLYQQLEKRYGIDRSHEPEALTVGRGESQLNEPKKPATHNVDARNTTAHDEPVMPVYSREDVTSPAPSVSQNTGSSLAMNKSRPFSLMTAK